MFYRVILTNKLVFKYNESVNDWFCISNTSAIKQNTSDFNFDVVTYQCDVQDQLERLTGVIIWKKDFNIKKQYFEYASDQNCRQQPYNKDYKTRYYFKIEKVESIVFSSMKGWFK